MMYMTLKYGRALQQIQSRVNGLTEISMPRTQEQIAKAVFTIAAIDFTKRINSKAMGNKKTYHHLYEWKNVGVLSEKLFRIDRTSVAGGNLQIQSRFLKSERKVPVHPTLKRRNPKTGKRVEERHIFWNKAQVMEYKLPIKPYAAFDAQALAIHKLNVRKKNPKHILFIRPPRTSAPKNPGGKFTTQAFTKFYKEYFSKATNINNAISSSGYIKSLEKAIARSFRESGNPGVNVRKAIREVSLTYSKGLTSY